MRYAPLSIIFDDSMNLNQRQYGNPFITTVKAILGSVLIINFSNILADYKASFIKIILSNIGRLSLIILIFHLFFESKSYKVFSQVLSFNTITSSIFSFIIGVIGPIFLYTIFMNKIHFIKMVCGNIQISWTGLITKDSKNND